MKKENLKQAKDIVDKIQLLEKQIKYLSGNHLKISNVSVEATYGQSTMQHNNILPEIFDTEIIVLNGITNCENAIRELKEDYDKLDKEV